jgi:2-polyprenyl-6-hydroxyphenyl methylase / 3-demethylubiquinone-9 3-methyltransferase
MVRADNTIYDRPGDLWWDDRGELAPLRTSLNPARVGYFREALARLGVDPRGAAALDVGCGGGLLAEEFARLGCRVTGVDPSETALAVARAHAKASGLDITYAAGAGEALPVADGAFPIVYCCDVLEHVADPARVVTACAQKLAPGGVFLFDTINRTWRSRALAIWLIQEWPLTRVVPPGLHAWEQFITPREVMAMLAASGLECGEIVGLTPQVTPAVFGALWRHKRGALTAGELGRRLPYAISRDTSVSYAGFARKPR